MSPWDTRAHQEGLMDSSEIESLFLWIIEEQLRLSRQIGNTQEALHLFLSSVGENVPQELQQHIDRLLDAHRRDDLIRALSQAAKQIREKSEDIQNSFQA
jgi:hypothetical protein